MKNIGQEKAFHDSAYKVVHAKSYYVLSFLIVMLMVLGTTAISFFVPDIIWKDNPWSSMFGAQNLTYFDYFNTYCFKLNDSISSGRFAYGIIYWITFIPFVVFAMFGLWTVLRPFFCALGYRRWINKYMHEHAKIINSCDTSTFKDRVAICVPTCNDFSPSTILQTAKQTYKCDVWICDDSSKPEFIKKIKEFADQHGYHVLRRDDAHKKAHPTKAGNFFYFIDKIGDQYDYILENDSSSIITSHFVENALCYFHNPYLDPSKVGGIVATGHFYNTKNLLSRINGVQSQYNEAHVFGGAIRLTGSPIYLQGWGTLFATSALKTIPLEKIECPDCDMTRGMYLTLHGYNNYWCPFDFSGKIGQQNIQAWKNQRLKWNGGDVWMFKNDLVNVNYKNTRKNLFIRSISWPTVIIIPITVVLGFIFSIVSLILNIFYFNVTTLVFIIILWAVAIISIITIILVKKMDLFSLICTILLLIPEAAIIYYRVYQIAVKGWILNKWSSGAVTLKTERRSSPKEKFKMIYPHLIWMLCITGVCLILHFLPAMNGPVLNPFIIWLQLWTVLVGPSIAFILCAILGEIPIKKGWDSKTENLDIASLDFRYKYIKESEIWKKQNR